MADVFISYSHKDESVACLVVARLRQEGLSVWVDHDLESGRRFDEQIESELAAAHNVVVLWSVHSAASDYVRGEVRAARDRQRGSASCKLFAARLDDCALAYDLGQLHTLDLRGLAHGMADQALDRLVLDIKGLGNPGGRFERAVRRVVLWAVAAWTSTTLGIGLGALGILVLVAGLMSWMPRMVLLSLYASQRLTPTAIDDALRVVMISERSETNLADEQLDPNRTCREAKGQQTQSFGPAWRFHHARVIERLAQAEARVIAFDIAFPSIAQPAYLHCANARLAAAIKDARASGTAVFAVARRRTAAGELDVEPAIAAALREPARASGGAVHGCMGGVTGGATMIPVMLTGGAALSGLGVASVAAFRGATPRWDDERARIALDLSERPTETLDHSGMSEPLQDAPPGCEVARAGQRCALRILDRFPRELPRDDARVLAYERVLKEDGWQEAVRGKIVLLGLNQRGKDRHQTCGGEEECGEVSGLSLQASAIDTLFRPEALRVITPAWQFAWIVFGCFAVALGRFALATRAARWRFACLAAFLGLDVAVSAYLASERGLLVDVAHHVVAMIFAYRIAAWRRPALRPLHN